MSLPVAPQAVTLYDVAKDFGFPALVAIILLFQIGPKLDQVAEHDTQVAAQLAVVSASCVTSRNA